MISKFRMFHPPLVQVLYSIKSFYKGVLKRTYLLYKVPYYTIYVFIYYIGPKTDDADHFEEGS